MSDIQIKPGNDGGEIEIINGKPTMTAGIDNAIYLSVFTSPYWGNAIAPVNERYTSILPSIVDGGVLTNQTRLDVIESVRGALQWMITDGLASRIDVEAEIPDFSSLYIRVRVYEAGGETESVYAINWDKQEVQRG